MQHLIQKINAQEVLSALKSCLAQDRDSLSELLNTHGIEARPAWTLMHRLPMFQDSPKMDLTTAESLESRLINIPSSVFL